ncbi:MAG: GIY-YIG nuclease family protein [Elusimicrobia bacterium]|nr:GIY-YIG nuclease family protein [Candidatus Liberimonas magnetica]
MLKNNLVCQYLENISRGAFEKYQNVIKKYVRHRHGIYSLYKNNKLYYVGLASNLRTRLKRHLRDRHANAWDSFSIYLTTSGEHLHELEALLLRIIDRKGNKQRGKFGKAEDLKRKLRNDLKKALNIELENIFCGKKKQLKELNKKILNKKGKVAVLAPFVEKRFHIRYKLKKKLFIAHVRTDGTITFDRTSADYKRLKNKTFYSPSLAAAAAASKRSRNGWTCWQYQRSPGEWVLLNELRK